MVPCALDICVATKVLDHSALADGLNLVSSRQVDKKIKALVLNPSTVWHNSVKKKRKKKKGREKLSFMQCGKNRHVHTQTGKIIIIIILIMLFIYKAFLQVLKVTLHLF